MERQSRGGMNRRQSLKALMAGGAALLSPIRLTHAQGAIEAGQPLPPLLMESYPDQFTSRPRASMPASSPNSAIPSTTSRSAFASDLGKVTVARTS